MTLVSFAEEGLEKLNGQKDYQGDDNLRTLAVKILEFYRNEGLVTYPAYVEFHIITDNSQKTVKKINAIRESNRAQADVDEYNSAVKRYNDAVNTSNKANKTSFKKNQQFIDQWNKVVEKFFNKHS